ncbi:MAG: glutamate-1-semialdehyde 2,1-aminomutase [Archangium sp.]|nr:glutamate-1-semialdehyde 2,1-aminomutase [Archangium sp.]
MTGSPGASERLFSRARALMPGGVSSPVRAFGSVGGTPRYMSRGEGAWMFDEDGRKYLDFCMAWGPNILGHAHPAVIDAVLRAAKDGLAFGTCHRNELAMAELVLEAFAPADRVRFVVSGTEAVMTAIRLARAHTSRKLLLKFSGCYHGHADAMMVKAGSGVVTLGLAESEGVTVAHDTLVAPLGDIEALEQVFREHGRQLAAAFIEPLPANNGLLIQEPRFLKRLRELTSEHGALLVFDEVINGFRFGFHGYSKVVGVQPDLTTLGKIIGGGLPVGAVVGRAEIMERLAPLGKTYQAGTMAGNPVALAAGIATLTELRTGAPYRHLEALGGLMDNAVAEKKNRAFRMVRVGSLFWPYYSLNGPIPTQAEKIAPEAVASFKSRYGQWLEAGLYLPPSAYEVGFLSAAHSPNDVEQLVAAL